MTGDYGHRYGRKAPDRSRPRLKLASILSGTVPDHPLAVDYGARIDGWGMRLNDRYGTCMSAAVANSRLLTTTWLADQPINWSDDQVAEFYRTQNPRFPDQDEGMNMQQALESAHNAGVPELGPDGQPIKAVAFAEVDLSNPDEINAAVAIFGGVLYGVIVTRANEQQFANRLDWDFVSGSPQEGGHAIAGVGYDDGQRFITWAEETEFTRRFEQTLAEEAWVVIWPEHLSTRQFAQGVDLEGLAAAYRQLTHHELVIPHPVPVPPAPAPSGGGDSPFRGVDPRLVPHIEAAARRRHMTVVEWLNWHLAGHFDLPRSAVVVS